MSNTTLKVSTPAPAFATTSPKAPVSLPKVESSRNEPQPFVGSYLWRKHFAKDGPAPCNEDGMVIGRDT